MIKDRIAEKDTPAFINPLAIGIVEQAQKGVIAPTTVAMKLPQIPLPAIHFLILSWDMYCKITPIIVLIPINRAVSSTVMITKYFKVSMSVFI